jgi:hypothetical protein
MEASCQFEAIEGTGMVVVDRKLDSSVVESWVAAMVALSRLTR